MNTPCRWLFRRAKAVLSLVRNDLQHVTEKSRGCAQLGLCATACDRGLYGITESTAKGLPMSQLIVNGEHITLSDDTDAHCVAEEVLDAMMAGGAVVHIAGQRGRTYDVVVTPTTQALVCHDMTPVDAPCDVEPESSSVNLDY